MAAVATTTLYEKIGGASTVEAVVEDFYNRILADKVLLGFFADTDMDRQKQSQTAFITMALGGPNNYDGKPMKEAHAGMGITELHFDKVTTYLAQALRSAGIGHEEVREVVVAMAPLKTQVVEA